MRHSQEKIRFVGNIMIDTLLNMRKRSGESTILADLGLQENGYVLVTLHRPSNVDRKDTFLGFVDVPGQTSRESPLVWPVHPRSRNRAEQFGLWEHLQGIDGRRELPKPLYWDGKTAGRIVEAIMNY